MDYNTALLTAAILGTRPTGIAELETNSALWATIHNLANDNLRQAEHKMTTKIGKKSKDAYFTEKKRQLRAAGQAA